MPFIQSLNIPKEKEIPFQIQDFRGGLVNNRSAFELRDNQSPNLLNVLNNQEGVLETRPGLFKYILNEIPEVINRMFVYETDDFSYILLSSKLNLYKVDLSDESITNVCAVNDVISGIQIKDKFLFVDGEKYREYDGTNVREIIAPITYVGKAVGGTLTTIIFPDDAETSDDYYNNWWISITSGTGYGQTKQITDYDGSTRTATVEWDNLVDDTSVFYVTNKKQGELTIDDTTICYTPNNLEFVDTYMGANNIADVSKCKLIELHRNKVYLTLSDKPNIVYGSDLNNPYYIPTNGYTPTITNDAKNITGIKSFNDVLCIFKQNTVFALYGDTHLDYVLKEVTVPHGAINNDVIQKVGNYLFYFGSDGKVYSMYDVRTDVKKMSAKCISNDINLLLSPISLMESDYANSRAIYYKDMYMLSVGDKILVCNTNLLTYTLWDNIKPTAFVIYEGILLITNENKYLYRLPFDRFYVTEEFYSVIGDNEFEVKKGYLNDTSDIFVYINGVKVDTTRYEKISNTKLLVYDCGSNDFIKIEYLSLLNYSDDGAYYKARWHSKDFDFETPSKFKQFRKIHITANTYKYYDSIIKFVTRIDHDDVLQQVSIVNKIPLFGVARFGDRFIKRNIEQSPPININKRGKIIRFTLENEDVNQPFKIYKISGNAILK